MYLVGRVGSECVCEGYVRGRKRVLEGSSIFGINSFKSKPSTNFYHKITRQVLTTQVV